MEILKVPPIEYGVATYALPGHNESGDRHLVRRCSEAILIAAVDGLGHGEEAANAAKVAISALEDSSEESLVSLVQLCHESLRSTRGVVMSLASINLEQGMMTWLGVGNVRGVMVRHGAKNGEQEELLLRGGVVGAQLPPLQAAAIPIAKGDTLIFATDGIHNDFSTRLSALDSPQRLADKILEHYSRGNDDALVLVTRYLENHS
jgi:serine phosphatase RsbU (regulator of sigma subunit)